MRTATKKRWTLPLAWAAVTILGIATSPRAEAAGLDRSFPTDGLQQLRVNLQFVDVEVRGWDKESVAVVADDPRIRVELQNGVLSVEEPESGKRGSGSLSVHIPATVAASLTTLSGDLQVHDMRSKVSIRSVSGEVEIRRLKGVLHAATVSGDLDIVDLTGKCELETVSGEVDARTVAATLFEARTVSGDVVVRDAKVATVELKSQSGEIRFDGALPADGGIEAKSFSGDVELRFPKGFSFELDAKSRSGDVQVDGPLTTFERGSSRVEGRVGEGGPTVRVSTFSGEVSVRAR